MRCCDKPEVAMGVGGENGDGAGQRRHGPGHRQAWLGRKMWSCLTAVGAGMGAALPCPKSF